MNNQRRTFLTEIAKHLDELRADIQDISDEEQEAFESMPDSLQGSERGEESQEAVSTLESVTSTLEDAIEELQCIDGVWVEVERKKLTSWEARHKQSMKVVRAESNLKKQKRLLEKMKVTPVAVETI